MKAATTALVGVQFALGCVVTAFAASTLLLSGKPGAPSLVILMAAYVPYAGVGSILVARRPRNVIGWVLLGMGWTFAMSFLPIDATAQQLQTMTASPLQEAIAWLTEVTVSLTFALFALLAFCYPTGRLASGRWRRVAALVLVLIWGTVVISAFWPVLTLEVAGTADTVEFPNPIGLLRVFEFALPSQSLGITVLPFIMVASLAAIVGRYKGSRDVERLQMRWLVASFGVIALAVIAGLATGIMFDQPTARGPISAPAIDGEIAWVPASLAFMLPPIAIGIAVTRHRLYEIDRLVSRGVSWAVLSGLLVALYAGAVILLQGVLGDVTQGETLAVAGSTLLAAALFQPLRRRIQSVVDRRFDRARFDGETTAGAFSVRMRDATDLPTIANDFDVTVRRAIAPSSLGLWLRGGE